jgi:hypothetical protein
MLVLPQRIVAQHATHHAAVAGAGIRAEIKTLALASSRFNSSRINARLNFYPTFFFVDFENAGKVPGDIHYNPSPTHWPAKLVPAVRGMSEVPFVLANLMRALISALVFG